MYNIYEHVVWCPRHTRKILLVMKLTTLIMILAIMQVSAGVNAQKVSLSVRNAPLTTVFSQIRSQTGYDFAFTGQTLQDAKNVTLKVNNEELTDVLKQIFSEQPLDYSIEDKTIVVSVKQPSLLDKIKKTVSEFVAATDVAGRVTDENGQPLPGATVQVKGGNNATLTDVKGYFSLKQVQPGAMIVISFIGYDKKEVTATADLGTTRLSQTNSKLDEVQVIAYLIFGMLGMLATRKLAKRMHIQDHFHNDIVSYNLAAVTIFYGITLGLVAIGTWNTFSEINNKVDVEAQVVASLYRDLDSLPNTVKTELKGDLLAYTQNVIKVSWPLQAKGIPPVQAALYLDRFQSHLIGFEPKSVREQVTFTELFRQFNALVEVRRSRVNATLTRLPSSLWSLVIIGGLICLSVTFFFDVKSNKMHLVMTWFFSGLLGLMIFLIGTLDNPFRGGVSVSSKPLQLVYKQMLTDK